MRDAVRDTDARYHFNSFVSFNAIRIGPEFANGAVCTLRVVLKAQTETIDRISSRFTVALAAFSITFPRLKTTI